MIFSPSLLHPQLTKQGCDPAKEAGQLGTQRCTAEMPHLNGQWLWIPHDLWRIMDHWGIMILQLLNISIVSFYCFYTGNTRMDTCGKANVSFLHCKLYFEYMCKCTLLIIMENQIIIHPLHDFWEILRTCFFPSRIWWPEDNDGDLSMMGWTSFTFATKWMRELIYFKNMAEHDLTPTNWSATLSLKIPKLSSVRMMDGLPVAQRLWNRYEQMGLEGTIMHHPCPVESNRHPWFQSRESPASSAKWGIGTPCLQHTWDLQTHGGTVIFCSTRGKRLRIPFFR